MNHTFTASALLSTLLPGACATFKVPTPTRVEACSTVRSAELDPVVQTQAPLELKKATDSPEVTPLNGEYPNGTTAEWVMQRATVQSCATSAERLSNSANTLFRQPTPARLWPALSSAGRTCIPSPPTFRSAFGRAGGALHEHP